ncbi:uncharacterized protein PGTG_14731 [Puccinia graminis f. sp. tritici CRL 75-36-700-3]|uniref:Uncharacterized protein n=1 Tax=Puccinia graminis f. sp. tritici (strain CRL 75-36-700-3 / race SCCL) TaxID=418459 RepID=E3KWU8_PUCGT|nr:uncharacterized protein PGTG_14731 [Puccinia graminis f. sp. tritici CRL 75-36-700-3]EFP88765.1 hypothetical protein PGTG_14731 [Puccinia graminis f. sp. tritici CRL 75-36-700-3]
MDCSLRTKLSSFLKIFILIIIQFGACYGTFKCNDHGGKHHGKYQALCMRHMRDEWPDYPDLVRSKFNGYRRAQYYMLRDGNLCEPFLQSPIAILFISTSLIVAIMYIVYISDFRPRLFSGACIGKRQCLYLREQIDLGASDREEVCRYCLEATRR